MYSYSPLRYPGGKTQLSKHIASIIKRNDLLGGTYAEPYAGGAGVAVYLLLFGHVREIHINDIDHSVYAFWYSLKEQPDELCKKIRETPVTIDNWHIQKAIQQHQEDYDIFDIGFSTFFLNRTNRSGILKGGIIGGQNQDGIYKLDCRYNKANLIERIERIAKHKEHIHISNLDAIEFLTANKEVFGDKTLVYLDPPYYNKGQQLYINYYTHNDHVRLKEYVSQLEGNWIITYDDAEEIKELYRSFNQHPLSISYFAAEKRKGTEILFYSPRLNIAL